MILLKLICTETHQFSILLFFFPEQYPAPSSSTDELYVVQTRFALSFCVRQCLKSWSMGLRSHVASLVWPVSARSIRKWLGSRLLCLTGCGSRRRWSGKLAALRSALLHVESSLGALSPLGAGCWCSYTHTLQQQSSPGWTAGNSLSWQNRTFWQDSLLQQPPPFPCRRSNTSRSAAVAAWLPSCCCHRHHHAGRGCFASQTQGETPVPRGGTLFPLHPAHCGTFAGSEGMVTSQFEPPNFVTDALVFFPVYCLLISRFTPFFSSVQCPSPFYFQRNEHSLAESPSDCSRGDPADLTTEVSAQQQTKARPWSLPHALLPLSSSPDAIT